MPNKLKGHDDAVKVLKKNLTPRYLSLDSLEAYVEGRQYEGLPHFFNDKVPLVRRAPCIIEPIVESAIESYQDLIFGDSRFPEASAGTEENDEPFDAQFGLSPEDSITLEKLICAAIKQANAAEVSREALAQAMATRTAVGLVCVRDGRLAVDLEPAKSCTPTFSTERPDELVALEIKYPYLDVFWDDQDKCWAERCMIYRRVIDETSDITFFPFVAVVNGEQPKKESWRPQHEIKHNFGFCPVIWYAYRKVKSKRKDIDGIAIHERQLDEIDALNRTLSQKHRAGLYCGDPQIVETGVGEDDNPGPAGDTAEPMKAYVDSSGSQIESPSVREQNAQWRTGSARQKGVNNVWRYKSSTAKVDYLCLEQGALDPLDKDAEGMRSLIAEALSWVRPLEANSTNSKVNISRLSSKTLSLLYKRQTSQCDTVRPNVWNGWLNPLIQMFLRVILVYAEDQTRGKLYLGGIETAVQLLTRFRVDTINLDGTSAGKKRWFNPSLSPIWGEYFEPDEQDMLVLSQQIASDYLNGFITKKTALKKLSKFYDIDNIEAYLETLVKEVADKQQQESDLRVNEMKQVHAFTATDTGGGSG